MPKWADQKKRYKQYQSRVEQLPTSHRAAIEAVERYAVRFGPGTGESLVPMLEDLVQVFEKGAANDTPVRTIVGDDPVQFVEDFLRNYPVSEWIGSEQQRLVEAIDRAAAADADGQLRGRS